MTNLGSNLVLERPTKRNTRPEREPRVDASDVSTAELAECTCPDFCERDHDRD